MAVAIAMAIAAGVTTTGGVTEAMTMAIAMAVPVAMTVAESIVIAAGVAAKHVNPMAAVAATSTVGGEQGRVITCRHNFVFHSWLAIRTQL